MVQIKHTKGMLRVMIFFLASQLGCTVESATNRYSIQSEPEPTPYTLPVQRGPFRNDGDSIDLSNRPSILDVQLTDTGLIALTGFSTAGSFAMFKQNGKIWSSISSDRFGGASPSEWGVRCVDFFDKKNGWLVDYEQKVWASVDGGENWMSVGGLPNGNTTCEALQFTTTATGWYSDVDGLYKTENAGKTWKRVKTVRDGITVKFANAALGWAIAVDDENNSTIYSTANGGSSWVSHTFKKIRISDFYPITSEYGIASVWGLLYETWDAGLKIHQRPGLPQNFAVESLYCKDSAKWWIAGYNFAASKTTSPRNGSAQLYKTKDGGKSWLAVPIETKEHFFSKIKFFDEKFGVVIAQNSLYRTQDGGESWSEILRSE